MSSPRPHHKSQTDHPMTQKMFFYDITVPGVGSIGTWVGAEVIQDPVNKGNFLLRKDTGEVIFSCPKSYIRRLSNKEAVDAVKKSAAILKFIPDDTVNN